MMLAISKSFGFSLFAVLFILLFIRGEQVWHTTLFNDVNIELVRGIQSYPEQLSEVDNKLKNVFAQDCRAVWYRGLIAHKLEQWEQRNELWQTAVLCNSDYIVMAQYLAADDEELAATVLSARPDQAEAWFWRAKQQVKESQDEAIRMYQEGLKLNPNDSQRWIVLGYLLRSQDPPAAFEAYLQACYHGAPDYKGCFWAGQMAETLNDMESAIRYYRLSNLTRAQQRADELERIGQ